MALLDVRPGVAHRARRVVEKRLALGGRHHPEKIAWLLPVVVLEAMIPMPRVALERQRRLGEVGLVLPQPADYRKSYAQGLAEAKPACPELLACNRGAVAL